MIKYEGYDTFCAYTSIIHGVGCRHSCHPFYTGGDGTIPCFHSYGIQLSCSPNGIQYMKPVLPEGHSMHKIPNGYRIKLFKYCNPQNCWCPDHLKNCCIFLATLNRDQEQSPPNQLLWWQLPLFSGQLRLVGAGKNPKALLPSLSQKRKLPWGNRVPSSSSAYLGWELNEISLPAEPAFQRGWSRGHHYKRRPREQQQLCRSPRVWKSNWVPLQPK